MAKLGDLFVKLGLKSDEFKKGISEAKSKTQDFAGSIKSMSTTAKVAWAAVAAAVVKFATDAIKMTQTWGDKWTIEMEGIKGAYGAFVRQLSSGEGWSNLFENMAEAARIAREVAASLDEIFERKISLSYEEAQTNKTISELQLIMRDASKSDEERMEAARKIIELEKQLGETKRSVAQQEAEAQKKLFMSQTQLNEQETDYLLKNYNINRDSINQAREYLAERQRLEAQLKNALTPSGFQMGSGTNSAIAGEMAQKAQDELTALDAKTSGAIKNLSVLVQKYDKSNDELVKNMAQAEIAVTNVDTEINRASTRATAMLGSLQKANGVSLGSAPDQDPAAKIYQRAQDYAKSELKLLTEKYASEKELLQTYGYDAEALTNEYLGRLTALVDEQASKEAASYEQRHQLLVEKYQEAKALLESYGSDTTSLTEAFAAASCDAIEREVSELMSELEGIEPVEIDVMDLNLDEVNADIDAFLAAYEEQMHRAQALTDGFTWAVVGGFSDACQELMDQLMGLSEANAGAVLQALLQPLADLAVRTGEMIMAQGLAVEAFKSSLLSLNGVAAIATGAALIALGTAARAGLAALATNSGSATGIASTSSAISSSQNSIIGSVEDMELTVKIEGKLKGSDIVLAGQRTQASWAR